MSADTTDKLVVCLILVGGLATLPFVALRRINRWLRRG